MKKVILALASAALIGCLLLGWNSVKPFNVRAESAVSVDPVEAYKTLRERLRAAEKAQLNDIAHSAKDESLALMAQEQLILICLRDEQESTCEAILEMRGFDSPVVTVREESVNVILRAETLTQEESRVVMELICRETRIDADNVKIIPIN